MPRAMAKGLALTVLFGLALAQVPVTVTYYHAVPGQTDADPDVAACGPLAEAPVGEGDIIIALSRDMFSRDLCGRLVLVRVEGEVIWGVVWDTMHPRFVRYVDLLMPNGVRWKHGKARGELFWEYDG